MAKLTGGGILGNKNVAPPVRTGSPSRGSSPGAADQIGASLAFKREVVELGPWLHGRRAIRQSARPEFQVGAGTRENDTRLREPRNARLTSSRQLCTSQRYSQLFRSREIKGLNDEPS